VPIRKALTVTLWTLALFACTPAHLQRRFLPARGWVSDFANVIDSDTQKRLTVMAQELDQKTHAQIAVVTVESLGGLPIERYALELFNEWGIGHNDDKRGLLILLATSDHQWRIETGRGLEVLLPNKRLGRIGDKMRPDLLRRDYSRAVLKTASEIAAIVAADRSVSLTAVGLRSEP
jgi:uncharacterized protein